MAAKTVTTMEYRTRGLKTRIANQGVRCSRRRAGRVVEEVPSAERASPESVRASAGGADIMSVNAAACQGPSGSAAGWAVVFSPLAGGGGAASGNGDGSVKAGN